MKVAVVTRLIALICFLGASPCAAQPFRIDTPETFSEALAAWATKHKVPQAVVVVRRQGRIVHRAGIGGADPEATYLLASLSKPITGACVGLLIRDGKIGLDTPLEVALAGFFQKHGKPKDARILRVTIAQLLTHRAGFSGNDDRNDAATGTNLKAFMAAHSDAVSPLPDLLVRALAMDLLREPGSQFLYGNAAYLTLGAVIEEATGEPYESYCRKTVLEPVAAAGSIGPAWKVMGSYGGWRMSGAHYLAFLDQFNDTEVRFGSAVSAWMHAPVGKETSSSGAVWYGLGTAMRRSGKGYNVWHGGSWSYANFITYAVRWNDGTSWFVWAGRHFRAGTEPRSELDRMLAAAYRAVRRWP